MGTTGIGLLQPVDARADDGKKERQRAGRHAQIDEEGPGADGDQRSREGMLELHSASSLGGNLFFLRVGQHEAAARGVEVEQLGVAAPGDGGFHLALALLFAELLVEHVEEEVLGHGVVALGFQGAANLAQQQHVARRRRRGRVPSGEGFRSWRTPRRWAVMAASPSSMLRKPSNCAASTMGSRSSISKARSSARR